jgi:hypothetical protein
MRLGIARLVNIISLLAVCPILSLPFPGKGLMIAHHCRQCKTCIVSFCNYSVEAKLIEQLKVGPTRTMDEYY